MYLKKVDVHEVCTLIQSLIIMEKEKQRVITQEEIERFMNGIHPMERIVNMTYSYKNDFIRVYYRDQNDVKHCTKDPYYPFCWATFHACNKLCYGDRQEVKKLMSEFNIGVKRLSNTAIDGTVREEFNNGYIFMFYAKKPMSQAKFAQFFSRAQNSLYPKKDKFGNEKYDSKEDEKQYLIATPVEQHMISTGKRFFKGYNDYDDILRLIFDLETEGLDPTKHRIKLNGVKMNRPFNYNGKTIDKFERIFKLEGETEEEKDASELNIIETFIKIIYTFKPDVVTAHNGENFDWNFLIERCKKLGRTMEDLSKPYFVDVEDFIKKENRPSILKMGGEMENYFKTLVPKTIVTDSLHAVRRAQAMDSNMKEANLKYVTKYSKMVKNDRVYIPGELIDTTLSDKNKNYAFNFDNGDWYVYNKNAQDHTEPFTPGKNEDVFKLYTRNFIQDGYQLVSGEYIGDRYLLDDLWECDRVEWKYNSTNFLICKMLPVPYQKCTTMGTAGQWKALLMAWSFMNNLAIPMFGESKRFTGGLSRLLKTGYVDNVAKLDYNSLYPSIILTWAISDENDLLGSMLKFLEYVLTTRELYKGVKKQEGKIVDKLKGKVQDGTATQKEIEEYNRARASYSVADGKQLQMKCLGNSFFGSYGAPNVFPWGSLKCAEQTTCIGRQSLRLLISHFTNLSYSPIVGDSVTGDTPLFVKYDNGVIDIKPISEIINKNTIEIDELGREYDYSSKNFKVLCRSGWCDVEYVYRHKTNKAIYEVSDGDMTIDVTEDHSLFNDKQEEIKPTQITFDTKLEYYTNDVTTDNNITLPFDFIEQDSTMVANGTLDRVPVYYFNCDKEIADEFYSKFMQKSQENITYSKTCIAGLQYIKKKCS